MSRCWAVQERLGRVACRRAALTPPDLRRLFILLRSLQRRPTPPRHMRAAVGRWPFEGRGSQSWDILLSPAPMVLEHPWGCGLPPAAWPCSSAPRSVLGGGGPASPPAQEWARAMGGRGGTSGGTRQSHLVGADEPMSLWGASLIALSRRLPLASLLPAAACLPPTPPASQGCRVARG